MSYSKIILNDRPDIVWGFDDITDSSSVSNAINFFTTSANSYAASININATNVIQVPIIFGGGTVISLNSSSVANISIPLLNRFSELYDNRTYAIEFWLQVNKALPQEITLLKRKNSSNLGLFLKENYLIYRYGNSSSYSEISYGLADISNPTHIVMNHGQSNIELLVNGVSTQQTVLQNQRPAVDPSHSDNNILEFYGHENIKIFVDCVAFYSYTLSQNMAKKHYFFGVGKNFDESIFFNLAGDYYNFSTDTTKKFYYDYWYRPEDWRLSQNTNLIHNLNGIFNIQYEEPFMYSSDNQITTTNNRIKFSSASNTQSSFIEIRNIGALFPQTNHPFFTKIIFNGDLPVSGSSQTIMSYSSNPYNEIIKFTLNNTSGSYFLKVVDALTSSALSFFIPSITSSPTAYLGMKYDGTSVYYFSLSGSPVQSASFTTYSGSVFGTDPLGGKFPPGPNNTVRIASDFSYDENLAADGNVNQFYGTFLSFMVASAGFSPSAYSDIDSHAKYIYRSTYDSSLNRFKISSYGTFNFILHGARVAQIIPETGSAIISSNRFEFGYPDVLSGSQVSIYASLYDYSSSVAIYPKTLLQKNNSLEWLNLKNIKSNYLLFEIEMLGDDVRQYPPTITSFKGEAYQFTGSYTDITDRSGGFIRIVNNASAQAYIPEIYETPSVFLTDSSGVKLSNSIADIRFRPEVIGTIGAYIKFNNQITTPYKFIEIFSASNASVSLFSASINSSNIVSMTSSSAKLYVNGNSASSIYSENWAHIIFTFNPKLQTSSANQFIVRFGNQSYSDFNIQNIYILQALFLDEEASYIHNGLNGGSAVLTTGDSASFSLKLIDRDERLNASQLTGRVYQPYLTQNRFLSDITSAIDGSASTYLTNEIFGDNAFFDGIKISVGDKILSLQDNEIYELTASSKLTTVSSSNGDYVNVLSGITYKNTSFLKVSGSFTKTELVPKIVTYLA